MTRSTPALSNRDKPDAFDVFLAVVLTVVLVFVSAVLSVLGLFVSMNVDGCSDPARHCNFDVIQAALLMTPVAGAIGVVATVILTIAFARTDRKIWAAPAIGLAFVVVAFIVAVVMNAAAT
jgi:uncharacterized BrkB/YihY/UPF0761 family membrane protein